MRTLLDLRAPTLRRWRAASVVSMTLVVSAAVPPLSSTTTRGDPADAPDQVSPRPATHVAPDGAAADTDLDEAPDALLDCDGPTVAPGFLTIDSRPWTRVRIDGEPVGSTPLFRLQLPAGRHDVRLIDEREAAVHEDSIEIEPGRTLKLRVLLATEEVPEDALSAAAGEQVGDADCAEHPAAPAYLSVRTEPWSRVFVDGRYLGHTPLFRVAVGPGPHVVRMQRDGERRMQLFTRFDAIPGETVKIDVARP